MLMKGCGVPNKENNKSHDTEGTKRRKNREAELYDMFYVFDKDRNGSISSEELSSVMMQFGGLSQKEINIMLAEADIDGDGQVVYTLII